MDASTERDARLPMLGVMATTLAVVTWGGASILVKSIDGIDGIGISAYRLWFGAVLLSGMHLAMGGRITWRLLRLCIPGGIAFGLDIVLFFSALRETSVANATVIGALQPILLLPIGARMFGERVAGRTVFWSAVSVAGTAIVVLGATGLPTWSAGGDLLALGALFTWTAYFVFSKQVRSQLGAIEYFCGLTIVSAVLVTPFVFVLDADLHPESSNDILAVVALTIFSGAIGHVLLNWSHPHVPLQVMSILTLLVPVVATAGSVVLLDEQITLAQTIGMLVVIAALSAVVIDTSRPTKLVPSPQESISPTESPARDGG